jgi:hypothetical protein
MAVSPRAFCNVGRLCVAIVGVPNLSTKVECEWVFGVWILGTMELLSRSSNEQVQFAKWVLQADLEKRTAQAIASAASARARRRKHRVSVSLAVAVALGGVDSRSHRRLSRVFTGPRSLFGASRNYSIYGAASVASLPIVETAQREQAWRDGRSAIATMFTGYPV